MRKTRTRVILLCIAFIGMAFYHFRLDLSSPSEEYYTLDHWTGIYRNNSENRYKGEIILLTEAPLLSGNIKKHIEAVIWKKMSWDTLARYNTIRTYFYRQTDELTKDFKEREAPIGYYGRRDDFMSWRNHHEERVAQMSIIQGEGNTVHYFLYIYDSGYGFNCLIDITKLETSKNTFSSIDELYLTKRKELGIIDDEKN